jgi:lipoyl(octanoyl) transferase
MPNLIKARCLIDEPLAGVANMARDAALLACRLQPTLRFYRWKRPTLSLGYFQAASDFDLQEFQQAGIDVVRRRTGGKAILHDAEQTYSICFAESLFPGKGLAALMQMIHQILAAELSRQMQAKVELRRRQLLLSDQSASPWCFEDSSPLDLVVGQRKLLGSAARRSGGWILFHGSLVLQAPEVTPGVAEMAIEPDLDAIQTAIGKEFGWEFAAGDWSSEEISRAEQAQSQLLEPKFLLWK